MLKYIIIRTLIGLVTLVSIVVIAYSLFYLLQGQISTNLQMFTNNPFAFIGKTTNIANTNAVIKAEYNLNTSYINGLVATIRNLFSFNFGNSLFYNFAVSTLLLNAVKVSLVISVVSLIAVYGISLAISILWFKINSNKKYYLLYIVALFYAVPIFILANLLNFAVAPVTTVAIVCIVLAGLIFLTLLLINLIDYQTNLASVQFYKQNNINKINIIKWQNIGFVLLADLPAVLVGFLFGSSAIVEIIFNINGIGSLMYNAFKNVDYPILIATIYIIAIINIVTKIIADTILFKFNKNIAFKNTTNRYD